MCIIIICLNRSLPMVDGIKHKWAEIYQQHGRRLHDCPNGIDCPVLDKLLHLSACKVLLYLHHTTVNRRFDRQHDKTVVNVIMAILFNKKYDPVHLSKSINKISIQPNHFYSFIFYLFIYFLLSNQNERKKQKEKTG